MRSGLRFWFPVAAAVAVGGIAVSLGSQGHPLALPLDDAYIVLQYARTAAEGDPGAYTTGASTSTGVTSPLWAGLLGGAAILLRVVGTDLDRSLPLAALLTCTLCLALALGFGMELARRHGVRLPFALVPLVLVLLCPIVLFGFMNGMETGLYATALLAGAWTLTGGSLAWLVLTALARPEGAVLALGILAVRLLDSRPPSRALFLPAAFVILAAGLTLALPYLLTGDAASAWTAKALWVEPRHSVREFYGSRIVYFAGRCLWFGLSGARSQPPLDLAGTVFVPGAWPIWASALFLGGGGLLSLVRGRGRGLVLLWILASVAAVTAVAWDAQHYRYLVPAVPLLWTAAAVGWFAEPPLGEAPGRPFPRRVAGAILLAAAIAGAFAAPRGLGTSMRWLYRGACEEIESTQLRVGSWIDANLPREARIATHDVGAIAFASRRPVVDLVGLVTPELAGAYRQGEGALWEALSALPLGARPTHAAVVPAWMPYLSRTGLFVERLFTLSGRDGDRAPVGQSFEVWSLAWPGEDPLRWPEGDFCDQPRLHGPGAGKGDWRIADRLDVADPESEHLHDYRDPAADGTTVVRELGFGFPPDVTRVAAIDGGRDVGGPVSFSLRADPGAPALLVLRVTATRINSVPVRIGEWTGLLRFLRGETAFREAAVLIPGHVTDASPDGRLAVRIDAEGYRAFHWWLLSPTDPDAELPE